MNYKPWMSPLKHILILSVILLSLPSWSQTNPPIKVFVSVLPLEYLVEKVGGEHVRVSVMIPPGQSPATFEPTPRKMAELQGARLFFRVGVPAENGWMPRVISNNPQLEVIDVREGIKPRKLAAHSHEHDDTAAHPGLDPHVWNSPDTSLRIAATMRDALIRIDPTHQQDYNRNYRHLADMLEQVDATIKSKLENLQQRKFMVFHPSWGYFARHYDLEQIAIEQAGKAPGIRGLAQLMDQAKKLQIRSIIVQPQFSRRDAEAIAQETGAKVVAVDPLAHDIPATLLKMAEIIAGESSPQ